MDQPQRRSSSKVQHARYFWLLMLKTKPTRMVLDNGLRVMPDPEGTK
jgi:hypothetical protein